MKTIELDACRKELVRDILATDNVEVLKAVHRAYRRAMNKTMKETEREELPSYTVEELNTRLDEAETEFRAGEGIPAEVAHQRMKQFIANL